MIPYPLKFGSAETMIYLV